MIEPAIEVSQVTKTFGATTAVNEVSLHVESGEFFSLLGPSGCGKTTLLRMIAGFETPTSGKILVAGSDVSGVPPHKRPVNMVFQSYALFPHLSVFENVAFGLRSARVGGEALSARVLEALQLVQLQAFKDRFPRQLSGGQQQRVALARAVVNRPAVLLLDEPLSALDSKIRQEMQEELSRLQKQLDMTFVMVTHDQGEALAMSNRIAVFHQGRVEQLGSPEEIYSRPKTPFVADFIGESNMLEGVVDTVAAQFARVTIAEDFLLWAAIKDGSTTVAVGDRVKVFMRIQSLTLSRTKGDGNETASGRELEQNRTTNSFRGIILARCYQGTTTEYRLSVGPTILQAACPSGDDFRPGNPVTVSLEADQVFLFPPSGSN